MSAAWDTRSAPCRSKERSSQPGFFALTNSLKLARTATTRERRFLEISSLANFVKFLQPELDDLGRQIIECCMDGGNVEDYEAFLPSVDLTP